MTKVNQAGSGNLKIYIHKQIRIESEFESQNLWQPGRNLPGRDMLSILTDAKRRPSANVGGGDWRPSSCSLSISFCSPCITANPSRRRSAKEVALESYHYFSKFISASLSLLEKYVFCLVTSVGQRKKFRVPFRNWTSDLWFPCFDALPLSHRDSIVDRVYYKVHILTFTQTVVWRVVKQGYSSKCSIPIASTWLCAQTIFCMVDLILDRNLLGW